MNSYTFLETKEVELSKMYTFGGIKIQDYIYVDFIRELINNGKPIEEYSYFKWLNDKRTKTKSPMWGWIVTEEDAVKRVALALDLIGELKKGYNPKQNISLNSVGKPCGEIITLEKRGRKLHILDGHHRATILHCLGYKKVLSNIYKKQDVSKND